MRDFVRTLIPRNVFIEKASFQPELSKNSILSNDVKLYLLSLPFLEEPKILSRLDVFTFE